MLCSTLELLLFVAALAVPTTATPVMPIVIVPIRQVLQADSIVSELSIHSSLIKQQAPAQAPLSGPSRLKSYPGTKPLPKISPVDPKLQDEFVFLGEDVGRTLDDIWVDEEPLFFSEDSYPYMNLAVEACAATASERHIATFNVFYTKHGDYGRPGYGCIMMNSAMELTPDLSKRSHAVGRSYLYSKD